MTQDSSAFAWPPPSPPADRVDTPTPLPAMPQWIPPNAGAMQGDLIWSGANWTWKTGLRRDGYQWIGREWVDPLPQHWWQSSKLWLLIPFLAIAFILGGTYLGSQLLFEPRSGGGAGVGDSASELRRDAYTECKVAVLGYLKSPGSADFPWYDPTFVAGSSPQYLVNAYVDAENSFGASIRTPWSCSVTKIPSGWRVDNVVRE